MALKNLQLFSRNHMMLFFLLLITQIFAAVIILLAYGVYLNNQYLMNEDENEESSFKIYFSDEQNSYELGKKIKESFPALFREYEDALDYGLIYSDLEFEGEKKGAYTEFTIQNGKYTSNIRDFYGMAIDGDYFSEEELNKGKKVVIISRNLWEKYGNTVIINSDSYKVTAKERNPEDIKSDFSKIAFEINEVLISVEALPDNVELQEIYLCFKRALKKSEYESLKQSFEEMFGYGVASFSDFYIVEINVTATMRTMMLVSCFLTALSAYCICMIYQFILEQRIKMTAVYRICGSTTWCAAEVYIKEMMILQLTSLIIGVGVFWYVLRPALNNQYRWFSVIYESRTCFVYLAIYTVLVLLIAILMIEIKMKKTPIVLLK